MRVQSTPHVRARFRAHFLEADPLECWLWNGGLTHDGYGQFHVQKLNGVWTSFHAHRMAWFLRYGPFANDRVICHRCDERYAVTDLTYRRCVNIAHLFIGTAGDNVRDMFREGRQGNRAAFGDRNGSRLHPEKLVRGERAANAKLTARQVVEIRARYAKGGILYRELAEEFSVSRGLIGHIVRGLIWTSELN